MNTHLCSNGKSNSRSNGELQAVTGNSRALVLNVIGTMLRFVLCTMCRPNVTDPMDHACGHDRAPLRKAAHMSPLGL